MAGERRLRILARLVGRGPGGLKTKRLCEVCAEVTGMSGAGIMLMCGDVPRGSVCTTNKVSALIEQLQFALGEGPCVDAYLQDRPLLEPDLVEPGARSLAPIQGRSARRRFHSVHALPMPLRGTVIGALNLFHVEPGEIQPADVDAAQALADVATNSRIVIEQAKEWSPSAKSSTWNRPSRHCGTTPGTATFASPT